MKGIILALALSLFLFPGRATVRLRSPSLRLRLCSASLSVVEGSEVEGKEKPPTVYSLPLPPKPDYSAVDWLVGEWIGKSAAPSPPGDAHLSAGYDLDQRIVVFKETIHFTATGGVPATQEQWMGILTPDAGGRGFLLRMFSSTGFMTRYRAEVEKAVIHLYPAGGDLPPSGWLFRRTFTRSGETTLTETVQAAPPDKPFFDYYSFQFTRVSASPPGVPPAKPPSTAPEPASKPGQD
jgi:hypothetical protein